MGNKPSILYVEDELESASVKWLEQAGYEVTVAENGDQAVEKTTQRKFDCILLDIMIAPRGERVPPGIPSWQLGLYILRCLRDNKHEDRKKFEKNWDTPVIVVSGIADLGDTREIRDTVGKANYLVKPFHPRVLVEKVQEVLGRRA